MPRPKRLRKISYSPSVRYFKPQGVPMRALEQVELTHEELEALRLRNLKGLDQVSCAKEMNTSQSTFQRILSSAYKKITLALVCGRSIKIS